ncbi:hypothetical protein G4G28_23515 [Massilia sp. Dwa41.01b]|uniref:hypothetical protein n=1 Tax=unclassified Massilia TaxID=2609279 RepID=UPI0016048ED7|nr:MULTISPECIES: hypothetical protein [unclassified Massilia]QNA90736.1 hypothetical protein G4G28_23515 [Massilia sp. Dwa41.01b]QNA97973.1 hypothetical protein G4G31_02600 [Massilia sp. Se16.2.3]
MKTERSTTFRGLPLTSEQDSEIRHYIHGRQRCGLPWETSELQAMLADMLDPPEVDEEDGTSLSDSMRAERVAVQDNEVDPDKLDVRHSH